MNLDSKRPTSIFTFTKIMTVIIGFTLTIILIFYYFNKSKKSQSKEWYLRIKHIGSFIN